MGAFFDRAHDHRGMRWDDLFADLEAQAAGLAQADRSARIAERARYETAQVTMSDRFAASIGASVRIRPTGTAVIAGRVLRTGADWLVVADTQFEYLLCLRWVVDVVGLSRRVAGAPVADSASNAPLTHALRCLGAERADVRISLCDGSSATGTIDRVGADFIDLVSRELGDGLAGSVRTVSTRAIAMLRCGLSTGGR